MKLLSEVREIRRKISLPIKREGLQGRLVPVDFTERETNLLIEMLTRRSKRHPTPGSHIFPTKMKRNKSALANSTQKRAMELIREGKWVI